MGKSVGAFWKRTYVKDGKEVKYMSGVVDLGVGGEVNVALFVNERKDKDGQPDYRLVLSDRKAKDNIESDFEPDGKEPF